MPYRWRRPRRGCSSARSGQKAIRTIRSCGFSIVRRERPCGRSPNGRRSWDSRWSIGVPPRISWSRRTAWSSRLMESSWLSTSTPGTSERLPNSSSVMRTMPNHSCVLRMDTASSGRPIWESTPSRTAGAPRATPAKRRTTSDWVSRSWQAAPPCGRSVP